MHILGLIIAVASAIFWVSRAARGAKDIADVASGIKNMPRKYKFKKKASQRGIDLIDHPIEAATILMVCIARLSNYSESHDGLLSESAQGRILKILQAHMLISASEADELITQMRWTVKDLVQPETALAPMTNIITASSNRAEIEELSDMLRKVSHAGGNANGPQRAFIERFRKRTGLEADNGER